MASTFTVVFDACVLFSAPLRDLLLQLSITETFRARWTDRIHAEWMNAVHERRGIPLEKLRQTRRKMDAHVLDCLVHGYEDIAEALKLPDADDRHVLAAAIRTGADVIVTSNVKDFPAEVFRTYGIDAQPPDEFIVHLLNLDAGLVCTSVKEIRTRLKRPPKSVDEYLGILHTQGLTRSVEILKTLAAHL